MQEQSTGNAAAPLRIDKKPSLRQMAVERVRAAIESRHLKAGQRVTELGLAGELGVAQATVREALVELESQGFVERRGAHRYITALSARDIEDIYLVRERLETLAVELLATARPGLQTASRACRDMQEAAQAGDPMQFYEADLAFHRALWHATENRSLQDALERLVPKLFAFGIIRHTHLSADQLMRTAELHQRLLELIGGGEIAAAVELTKASMTRARTDDASGLK
jgi:DNA-binding GntR family transcriptional regulator